MRANDGVDGRGASDGRGQGDAARASSAVTEWAVMAALIAGMLHVCERNGLAHVGLARAMPSRVSLMCRRLTLRGLFLSSLVSRDGDVQRFMSM